MSHSVILPPVHETSPPPFDDDEDVDEIDISPTNQNDESLSSTSPDVLNNSNDDWKSVDDNNDTDIAQIQDDTAIVTDENVLTTIDVANEEKTDAAENEFINEEQKDATENVFTNGDFAVEEKNDAMENVLTNIDVANEDDDHDWANFATFENKTDEVSETATATTSAVIEENTKNNWADFQSNAVSTPEQPMESPNEEQTHIEMEEDDDFGEFSEVQATPTSPPPSLPKADVLSSEQIESLISTCFPMECSTSSTDNDFPISTDLPSFTSHKHPTKQISCLESSLSLWNVLSNISNDPIGIKFQWRKSNTERLFHQALGVNERFRTKTVVLTPEILQPEKVKSINSDSHNLDHENKLSADTTRPHFDWKQSGLENPLADNDSASSINVFDANKTLDLDFYVPPTKSPNEEEQTISPASILRNDSPIIQTHNSRHSIPIKTVDLFPNSTTTLNDDAKRIIDTLPNLSFMSAKALMFPIRFNTNNTDESTTLY